MRITRAKTAARTVVATIAAAITSSPPPPRGPITTYEGPSPEALMTTLRDLPRLDGNRDKNANFLLGTLDINTPLPPGAPKPHWSHRTDGWASALLPPKFIEEENLAVVQSDSVRGSLLHNIPSARERELAVEVREKTAEGSKIIAEKAAVPAPVASAPAVTKNAESASQRIHLSSIGLARYEQQRAFAAIAAREQKAEEAAARPNGEKGVGTEGEKTAKGSKTKAMKAAGKTSKKTTKRSKPVPMVKGLYMMSGALPMPDIAEDSEVVVDTQAQVSSLPRKSLRQRGAEAWASSSKVERQTRSRKAELVAPANVEESVGTKGASAPESKTIAQVGPVEKKIGRVVAAPKVDEATPVARRTRQGVRASVAVADSAPVAAPALPSKKDAVAGKRKRNEKNSATGQDADVAEKPSAAQAPPAKRPRITLRVGPRLEQPAAAAASGLASAAAATSIPAATRSKRKRGEESKGQGSNNAGATGTAQPAAKKSRKGKGVAVATPAVVASASSSPLVLTRVVLGTTEYRDPGAGHRLMPSYIGKDAADIAKRRKYGWVHSAANAVERGVLIKPCSRAAAFMAQTGKVWEPSFLGYNPKTTNGFLSRCSFCSAKNIKADQCTANADRV